MSLQKYLKWLVSPMKYATFCFYMTDCLRQQWPEEAVEFYLCQTSKCHQGSCKPFRTYAINMQNRDFLHTVDAGQRHKPDVCY